MKVLFVLLLLCAAGASAQHDTSSIMKRPLDSAGVSKPVLVVRTLEMEEQEYKVIYNYFYIRPYISWYYYYNNYCNQSTNVLAQAYCYSVKEKGGYSGGMDIGYSYRNYNFVGGYAAQLFFEKVNDYKLNIQHHNHYYVHQLSFRFLYFFKRKSIYIAPFAGLSYNLFVVSHTFYPAYNERHRIEFREVNDFQVAGNFFANAGAEFRFLNTHRVSPFVAGAFSTGLKREGNSSKYSVGYNKYITSVTAGFLVKL